MFYLCFEIPIHRASLNTREEIPGLEIHIDHLDHSKSPTLWTLATVDENNNVFSLINDVAHPSPGCGVKVESNDNNKALGTHLNASYVLEVSNFELKDCISQWLNSTTDEVTSLHLMYYDDDRMQWQLAGRKFDIQLGGGWSAADYLWHPVYLEMLISGYSTPFLRDTTTDVSGFRRFVVKSSGFEQYKVNSGGLNSAQKGVISTTVPATLVEVTVLGSILVYFYRARRNLHQEYSPI
ncbi:MAG: hypothetical protein ACR2PX_16985 [Endozoicomonas sp.]|uniref:hypothetical protein n=1 Tax=Endozoicomonas sp. TaxID=1892382 RepID=UPI003D9B8689